jgi:hypothetical protein
VDLFFVFLAGVLAGGGAATYYFNRVKGGVKQPRHRYAIQRFWLKRKGPTGPFSYGVQRPA